LQKVILSVINDLSTDNRVHKVATTLVKNNYDVTLIGRKLPNSLEINRNYSTYRFALFFNKGPFFYIEYNIRLFFFLLFKNVDILVANDLDTLLANYLVSVIRTKKIIYDSHEYFIEVPELQNRKTVKSVWKFIEKTIVPKLKRTYTVSKPIADIYNKMYKTDFKVIRNYPNYSENQSSTNIIETSKKVIIYQGALNIGRGIELVIKAMKLIDNAIFAIIGDGDITQSLKNLIIDEGVNDKVLFLGKIPFEELHNYTKSANIGISLEDDTNLNYHYSLPNKLFDYIQAGIPVLVSNLPEMKKIVQDYNIGEVLMSRKVEDCSKLINDMLTNEIQQIEWKNNLKQAAKELCWENQEKELLNIFN